MRRNVCPGMAFSNGNYIFDSNFQQIDPQDPRGQIIESILVRQVEDKINSLPQKYRAEIAHNKDINNDGFIGPPKSISVDAEVNITSDVITIKPKKTRKKKQPKVLKVSSQSGVAVSDNSNKAQ